ncbi:protein NRT1/ PTR FAMILY 2.13 [Magnolia sinica]|uniref:protein NRT1/ PTR FAMILY 2.13 n=1 Tax=Magnolia sinica TaxID=86752 RepID=UPI00265A9C2B|nr:protein NRT1/ PTR FAMILY 2.13 [Magnolia sinica]
MKSSVGKLIYCMKGLPCRSSSADEKMEGENVFEGEKTIKMEGESVFEGEKKTKREPGGWKAMPYVIGNETFERLATLGLLMNFMVYLLQHLHLKQVFATNVINIWSGTTNFAPLVGAYLSDAYLGRFRILAYASVASFLGMVTLTLTTVVPELTPPKCNPDLEQCMGPTRAQMGMLYLALGLLTIGAGGIRPCNLPFGVDQFDATTEKGRQGIDSFFNWYYFTFNISMMIAMTVIVYIQDSVSWALGFGIPTALMFCSIILFFLGTKIYVYVPPEGSVFTGIAHVIAAAYKKRRLTLPPADEQPHVLYDPSPKGSAIIKLPLTQQFSFLNKAAIITDSELKSDGSPENPWRLGSIQHIEELKCLIRIVPIWAAGIITFTSIAQQATFTLSQALKMNRHIGPHFQIPAGSVGVVNMLALTLFVPIYDRILVPVSRKITKQPGGITLLQRMGIGMVISIFSMIVAGLVEEKRRKSAILHGGPAGIAPITVMWLAPQLALLGVAEAFNAIGQIEFYYKQFPEHMRSLAGSLLFLNFAGANYLSAFIVSLVHKNTGKHGRPDWLADNINKGKLDYFYYAIAGLGAINMVYFLVCSHFYRYKAIVQEEAKDVGVVIELNGTKSIDN